MSIPERLVDEIKKGCNSIIEKEAISNKEKLAVKEIELHEIQQKLFTLEEKWIGNEITRDTYDRWYSIYNNTVTDLKGAIHRLSADVGGVFKILKRNLNLLSNLPMVYNACNTLQKREFVNMVFDSNLYYQDGIYRTPTMMRMFTHNALTMKQKGYLIYEKKRDDSSIIPPSGVAGNRTRVQTSN